MRFMEFTKEEVEIIRRAKSGVRRAQVRKIIIALAIAAAFAMFLLGRMDAQTYAYLSVILVLGALLPPMVDGAPKYEELIKIFESKQ